MCWLLGLVVNRREHLDKAVQIGQDIFDRLALAFEAGNFFVRKLNVSCSLHLIIILDLRGNSRQGFRVFGVRKFLRKGTNLI